MNDNEPQIDTSAEALAIAERKLQLEEDTRLREAAVQAGVSTDVDAPPSNVTTEG